MNTEKLFLFTDGSVNQNLKFGYGAFLAVKETDIKESNIVNTLIFKEFKYHCL